MPIALLSLGSEDRRVRNAAISAMATALRADANGSQATTADALRNGDRTSARVHLASIRARLESPLSGVAFDELKETIGILEHAENDDVRFEAVRLVQLCLGDWRVDSPSAETFSAYESRFDLRSDDSLRIRLLRAVRPLIGKSGVRVNEECARVCAMLHDDDPALGGTVLGLINSQTSATSDFHFLAVLARLGGMLKAQDAPAVAAAITALDLKLAGGDQRPKQNWSVRLAEVVEGLVKRQPRVADALLQTPHFATAARLALVPSLGPAHLTDAARLYFSAAKDDPHFEWSPALIALLRKLPGAEVDSLIKAHSLGPPIAHPVSAEETARWEKLLDVVAWERGEVKRGERIFRERTCVSCHGAAVSIGPDLAGAARRFAPRDLLRAIVFPSRDIAEPYRATTFTLRDGTVRQGIVVFFSADGVMVQTGAGLTERIAESEIISRETSPLSLMPAGLLEGVSADDLADLHAYLKQL
jgi:putative heme-binding domain-containing protein